MGLVLHVGLEERTGEAFELGERLTVVGRQLRAGEVAPEYALDWFDPVGGSIVTVRRADSSGLVRLLDVVGSVDDPSRQPGCERWERLRADLPPGVLLCTISMDLPFALARWQRVGSEQRLLSAHRDERFGRGYGVLLKERRLLQRAVFVIGHDDRIAYAEYVADQLRDPDDGAALAAARRAAR